MKNQLRLLISGGLALALNAMTRAQDVAIVVGVSDYRAFADAQNGDLSYADEDARLFRRTAIECMGFKKENVIVLTSHPQEGEKQSTAENIINTFSELNGRITSPGKFCFFFSGNAIQTKSGPMLAAQNFDPQDPLVGYHAQMTADAIRDRLASLNVNLALGIFDIYRHPDLIAATKENNKLFLIPKRKAAKVATILSSVSGPSYESDELKQGYFTYFLCKGITPQKTSNLPMVPAMGGDGLVTLDSLKEYVTASLTQATGGKGVGRSPSLLSQSVASLEKGIGQRPSFDNAVNETLARFEPNQYKTELSAIAKYRTLINLAFDFLEGKDFEEAAVLFEQASKQAPFEKPADNSYSAFSAGWCYYVNGDRDSAERMYRNALALDPDDSGAGNNLGLLLDAKRNYQEAERLFRHVIEINPKDSDALVNLANLLVMVKRSTEAEKILSDVLARYPKNRSAMNSLCVIRLDMGDLKSAEKLIRDAMASGPESVELVSNLARLLFLKNDVEGARKQFEHALSLDPKGALPLYNLGRFHLGLGKFDDAEHYLRAALGTDPRYSEAMLNLGIILQQRKDYAGAEKLYQDAIAIAPDSGEPYLYLAILLNIQAKVDEAINMYKKSIAVAPSALAYHNLAVLFAGKGELLGAENAFRESVKLDPKLHNSIAGVGETLRLRGDYKGAVEWIKRAVDLDPKNVVYRIYLAASYLGMNRRAEAKAEAQKAYDLGLRNHPLLKELGIGKATK